MRLIFSYLKNNGKNGKISMLKLDVSLWNETPKKVRLKPGYDDSELTYNHH